MAIAIIVAMLGLNHVYSIPLNHDTAWFLNVSREVLSGARLYRDVIEINPPLIVWLGTPVILLENITGVKYTALYPVVIAVGAASSLTAAFRIARCTLKEDALPVFLVAGALVLFVLPVREWGQREHIMILLTLPYIVACGARAKGVQPKNSLPIGLAAGLGFALKPHFLLALLALEAWLLTRRKPWWKGTSVAVGTVVLYGLAAATLTSYLPMAWELRDVYAEFANARGGILLLDYRSLFIMATLAFVPVRGPSSELRTAFGLSAGALLVATLAQGKGFDYHFLPALSASILLVMLTAASVVERRLALAAAAIPALLIATLTAFLIPPENRDRWAEISELTSHAGGGPLLVLSADLGHVWPHVSYAGARWRMPGPSLWPVTTGDRGRRIAVSWVIPALDAAVPVLVPVDSAHNVLPLLAEHADFRSAWDAYELVAGGRYYNVFMSRSPASNDSDYAIRLR